MQPEEVLNELAQRMGRGQDMVRTRSVKLTCPECYSLNTSSCVFNLKQADVVWCTDGKHGKDFFENPPLTMGVSAG